MTDFKHYKSGSDMIEGNIDCEIQYNMDMNVHQQEATYMNSISYCSNINNNTEQTQYYAYQYQQINDDIEVPFGEPTDISHSHNLSKNIINYYAPTVSDNFERQTSYELIKNEATHDHDSSLNFNNNFTIAESKGPNGTTSTSKNMHIINNNSNNNNVNALTDTDSDPAQLYKVEAILDKKVDKGKVFYKIKWQDYPAAYNTWEPEENLLESQVLVLKFNQAQKMQDNLNDITYETPKKRRGRPPKIFETGSANGNQNQNQQTTCSNFDFSEDEHANSSTQSGPISLKSLGHSKGNNSTIIKKPSDATTNADSIATPINGQTAMPEKRTPKPTQKYTIFKDSQDKIRIINLTTPKTTSTQHKDKSFKNEDNFSFNNEHIVQPPLQEQCNGSIEQNIQSEMLLPALQSPSPLHQNNLNNNNYNNNNNNNNNIINNNNLSQCHKIVLTKTMSAEGRIQLNFQTNSSSSHSSTRINPLVLNDIEQPIKIEQKVKEKHIRKEINKFNLRVNTSYNYLNQNKLTSVMKKQKVQAPTLKNYRRGRKKMYGSNKVELSPVEIKKKVVLIDAEMLDYDAVLRSKAKYF